MVRPCWGLRLPLHHPVRPLQLQVFLSAFIILFIFCSLSFQADITLTPPSLHPVPIQVPDRVKKMTAIRCCIPVTPKGHAVYHKSFAPMPMIVLPFYSQSCKGDGDDAVLN